MVWVFFVACFGIFLLGLGHGGIPLLLGGKTGSLITLFLLFLFFSCISVFRTSFQSSSLIIQNECLVALLKVCE